MNIGTLVHGDDYASAGLLGTLRWQQRKFDATPEMKTVVVSHSKQGGVVTEGKILNRVLILCLDCI